MKREMGYGDQTRDNDDNHQISLFAFVVFVMMDFWSALRMIGSLARSGSSSCIRSLYHDAGLLLHVVYLLTDSIALIILDPSDYGQKDSASLNN